MVMIVISGLVKEVAKKFYYLKPHTSKRVMKSEGKKKNYEKKLNEEKSFFKVVKLY